MSIIHFRRQVFYDLLSVVPSNAAQKGRGSTQLSHSSSAFCSFQYPELFFRSTILVKFSSQEMFPGLGLKGETLNRVRSERRTPQVTTCCIKNTNFISPSLFPLFSAPFKLLFPSPFHSFLPRSAQSLGNNTLYRVQFTGLTFNQT